MKRFGLAWLFAIALLCAPRLANAQGCSLCRDSTAGSPAAVRQGLRRGILALGLPAAAIFFGILLVARQVQPGPPRA
jgi:hypothetical protein